MDYSGAGVMGVCLWFFFFFCIGSYLFYPKVWLVLCKFFFVFSMISLIRSLPLLCSSAALSLEQSTLSQLLWVSLRLNNLLALFCLFILSTSRSAQDLLPTLGSLLIVLWESYKGARDWTQDGHMQGKCPRHCTISLASTFCFPMIKQTQVHLRVLRKPWKNPHYLDYC